jgi:Rad3-related DNA helicase
VKPHPARYLLGKSINDFENELDNKLEAGIRLVSFGQTIQFHVNDIWDRNPSLIVFSGTLEDGSPVRLVQHMSQLSILLTVLTRKNPDQPRRTIGFSQSSEDE